MPSIEIYTRPGCGYCTAAKNLLNSKFIDFVEYNTATDSKKLNTMLAQAPTKTFPQIVINREWIGGFDDLLARNLSTEPTS